MNPAVSTHKYVAVLSLVVYCSFFGNQVFAKSETFTSEQEILMGDGIRSLNFRAAETVGLAWVEVILDNARFPGDTLIRTKNNVAQNFLHVEMKIEIKN
jgi:hypothetical protein